jgi:hypothetical protein
VSTCIGNNCYEQVVKDKTVYFIKSLVYSQNELTTETDLCKLTLMSDFIFDIVKHRYGNFGCTEELLLRK